MAGQSIKFDPDKPASEQLAAALRKGSARVLDLFRQWDTDGDGEVSKQEFLKAMPKLGFDVDKKDIEKLFDEWDTDGGGSLSFPELKKILTQARRPDSSKPDASKKLGGAVKAAKLSASASKGKL